MKIYFFSLLFFVFSFTSHAQVVERSFGGPESEFIYDMLVDSDGNILLASLTQSFSAGSNRAYLVKLNNDGVLIWEKVYPAYRNVNTILPRPEGGYIAWMQKAEGAFHVGDDPIFIVELDVEGNILSETYVKSFDMRWVISTSDDHFIVVGQTSFNTDGCAYVNKVNRTGDVIWSGCFGRNENDYAWRAMEDEDGNYVVGGISYRPGIQQGSDAILLKFSPVGTLIWEEYVGFSQAEEGADYAAGIAQMPNGNYRVLINTTPLVLVEISKSTGAVLDQRTLAPSDLRFGNELYTHPDGGYILVGSDQDFGSPSLDFYLLRLSENLDILWEKRYGGPLQELGYHAAVFPDGSYALAGVTRSFGNGESDLYFLRPDAEGNISNGMLSGRVAYDTNTDCVLDADELLLGDWLVQITNSAGSNTYAFTDENGFYAIPLDSGSYTLNLIPPNAYWQNCLVDSTIQITSTANTAIDFPVQQLIECPFLESSTNAYFLDPCNNGYIWVNYCNRGTSLTDTAYIELTLDSLFTVTNSDIPWVAVNENTYTFPLDSIGVNECGRFRVNIDLSCDATDIQALLIDSHIYPDSLCLTPSPGYTGAFLEVTANCESDEVTLEITNAGTGPMSGPQEYVVIEDAVLLESSPLSLNPGQSLSIPVPANGSTYYCAIPQEPGAPGGSLASTVIEGCGTNLDNNYSTGLTNQFALNDSNPFTSLSYHPSAAQLAEGACLAFPEGYGNQHLIAANTDITYVLPFQLPAYDSTAAPIQLELSAMVSEHLDLKSLQVTQSSHPYKVNMGPENQIKFYFPQLEFDSTAQEFQGFIGFRLAQNSDLAIGTIIESEFDLRTDFGAGLALQTIQHEVGENFVIVDIDEPGSSAVSVRVYPNPFVETVHFDTESLALTSTQQLSLQVFDMQGRLVSQKTNLVSDRFSWQRQGLAAGTYSFVLLVDNKAVVSGRLLML